MNLQIGTQCTKTKIEQMPWYEKDLDPDLELVNNDIRSDFGRIIFHTDDVDKLYSYLKNDTQISKLVYFETEPADAS